jgi:hypothetical protein
MGTGMITTVTHIDLGRLQLWRGSLAMAAAQGSGGLPAPAWEAAGGQAQEHQGLGQRFRSGLGPQRSGVEARPRARWHAGQSGVAVVIWLAVLDRWIVLGV